MERRRRAHLGADRSQVSSDHAETEVSLVATRYGAFPVPADTRSRRRWSASLALVGGKRLMHQQGVLGATNQILGEDRAAGMSENTTHGTGCLAGRWIASKEEVWRTRCFRAVTTKIPSTTSRLAQMESLCGGFMVHRRTIGAGLQL